MKKLLFILISFLLIFTTQAQVITGFDNITDTDGNTHSLSNYLDDGKYVILDFYIFDCGSCNATAPMIESIYNDYGQNQCNLIVLSFLADGSNTPETTTNIDCDNWAETNGCPSPPNFNYTETEWYQFYANHGGYMSQTYLITPNGDSVIYAHAGGVLDEDDLRTQLDSSVPDLTSYETRIESNSYIWNGIIYIASGEYTYNTTTSNGCDSIAVLNLTITNTTGIEDITNKRTLVKITDMLGQATPYRKNTPLFYIYDDGTVEKKIIIE